MSFLFSTLNQSKGLSPHSDLVQCPNERCLTFFCYTHKLSACFAGTKRKRDRKEKGISFNTLRVCFTLPCDIHLLINTVPSLQEYTSAHGIVRRVPILRKQEFVPTRKTADLLPQLHFSQVQKESYHYSLFVRFSTVFISVSLPFVNYA